MSVTVYTKKPCVQCDAVKRQFKKNGVEFNELDITAPEQADVLEAFKEAGLGSAPIVVAEGHKPFGGFQPDAVAAIVADYGVEQ